MVRQKRPVKFWFKNEKELMQSLGMKGTPGSGNRVIKEDGQNEHLIAQLKSTTGSSVTINLDDVTSLLYNATIAHKIPLFINQFVNGPILISVRLEDLKDVATYIETGECKKAKSSLVHLVSSDPSPKQKVVKSGGREVVKARMAAEREKEWKKRNEERKSKRK